ncbi:MAG: nucleotide exchange factor GrpE [Flavobacteriaceae bacterium]|nr:nucleotide exchange factor GrpE [Flavobacteriaceae bacterium]
MTIREFIDTMSKQEKVQEEKPKNKKAPKASKKAVEKELQEALQQEKDKFLRLFAEFENYKKRTTKERIELYGTANQELMTVLLPILDDFDRGLLEIEKSADKPVLEGMTLIYNKLNNILEQKGLKKMEIKQGADFDVDFHEAITQIPAPSKKLKGKIIDVVEKGYKLNEKVIRYAKVVIGQ